MKTVFAIATLIVLTALLVTSTEGSSPDLSRFKRKMMPKVGHRITVVGVLSSAKLGGILRVGDGGIYIYSVRVSDDSRMKALDGFNAQTVRAVGTLRYSPGSLSPRIDVASVPEHFFFDVAEVEIFNISPVAEIEVSELRYRTPPLVELYCNVLLRNNRAGPRWFLLPNNLGSESTPVGTKGGVDGVEVFAPHGKGRAIIGNFLGTGGFQALLLPANARMHLRIFPISYWGSLPDHLAMEVVTATRLTIGGEDARIWFRTNPTSSARADIKEIATSSTRMVRSRHTPNQKEVAFRIQKVKRFEVQVLLTK